MTEQSLASDQQFLGLLSAFLPKDLIRFSVWAISRIPGHGWRKLYRQCQLLDELIAHYQPVYRFTRVDKQIMFGGCLLADVGKYFSDQHYARIGYGLVYDYVSRAAPGMLADDVVDQIAQCVYDTRPRRRQPPNSIHSQLVYLANQGVPSASRLASGVVTMLLNSGLTDDVIIDHAGYALSDLYGENGTYWRSYPDMGRQYFYDEWETTLSQLHDIDYLTNLLTRIKEKHYERSQRVQPEESL